MHSVARPPCSVHRGSGLTRAKPNTPRCCCEQTPQAPVRSVVHRRSALALLLSTGSAGSELLSRSRVARADEPPVGGVTSGEANSAAGDIGGGAADAVPLSEGGSAVAAEAPSSPVEPTGTVRTLTDEERVVLEQNQRIRSLNRAPPDFPAFIRKGESQSLCCCLVCSDLRLTLRCAGYQVTVLADGYTYEPNGLIYKDMVVGDAGSASPGDGQQVVFNYIAYNESGVQIDSTFRQGRPAETRVGIGGMIPGFEAGIKAMRVGGKRRIIVPPELGPPVGPGTFFSSKQFEVFDVELLQIKNCTRQQMGMLSTVSCQ